MGIGLETLFHLVYELVHWIVAWLVPRVQVIEAHEMGVKVTGKKIKVLEPGFHPYHRKLSEVYADVVRRQVREAGDAVVTVDDVTWRITPYVAYEISNITKWLIDNEDAQDGLLTELQSTVLRQAGRTGVDFDRNPVPKHSLESKFGVTIEEIGVTCHAHTELRELNHTGIGDFKVVSPTEEDD